MFSLRWRDGALRVTAWVASSSTAALAVTGLLVLGAPSAGAAGLCATPGGSGAGGTLTGVVNTYYPGTGVVASGATSINVGPASGAANPIAAGDLLLVIQMQAADFDSTNTNAYGHGPPAVAPASGYTSLNQAGRYEYVRATSGVVAGSVGVSGLGPGAGLVNDYLSAAATGVAGQRTFQVVRVPQYTTATTSSTLTASPWNGSVGGVLALDTTSTLTLNGTVSVAGLGFRGGAGIQRGGAAGLANTDVATSATVAANGNKAEGIAGTPVGTSAGNGYPGGDAARGAPGNAGGGGTDGQPTANDQNSGGGGGGNGGAGGQGGNTWSSNLPRGGYGGVALPAGSSRAFLGGGGGAGTANNFPPPAANGAAGGGIVMIRAGTVGGAGTISANGADAYNLTANDGAGGGGAGGTVMLTSPSGSLAGATLTANGGRGGNAWATQAGAGSAHGPGGGGGGGWVLTSSAPTSASVTGGANGITTTGNLPYNATPGGAGQTATVTPSSIPGVSGGAECADLSITKSGPVSVSAGGTVSYDLTVANAGPSDAVAVSVVDTLPAGVSFVSVSAGGAWSCSNAGNVSVTCTRPLWAAGSPPETITVVVTAPAQASTLVNSASVSATTPDPDPTNNTATATTDVTALADLSVLKSGPVTVLAGGTVSYDLTVANAGPSDAVAVSVTDTLPAGVSFVSVSAGGAWSCSNAGNVSVTCTRPLFAAGAPASVITVVVTAPASATTLTNSVSVASTTADPDSTNNSDSVDTTVTASADLSVVKSGPGSVSAGGTVSYDLTVANAGPSDAVAVSVTDTLPAGVSFVSVSAGGAWSCSNAGNVSVTCTRPLWAAGSPPETITVVVTAPAQAGSLTNSVSVSSTTSDPDLTNNTDSVTTGVGDSADLSITKTGPAKVRAGGRIQYALHVRNLGPSAAASVVVTDALPGGVVFGSASGRGWSCGHTGNVSVTCTRPALGPGVQAPEISVVVTAPGRASTLRNVASVGSATPDPDSTNNSDSARTVVSAAADLSLVKVGPARTSVGATISYRLVVSNAGPDAAVGVKVTDTLPAGVSFGSASGSGWSCTSTSGRQVTCDRARLADGASAPAITVVVTAPASPVDLVNTAGVTAETDDPVDDNNAASAATSVLAHFEGSGGELPRTGGMDPRMLTLLGIVLIACGTALCSPWLPRMGRAR